MVPEYTRHTEWWEHKITLLLSTGILSLYSAGTVFSWENIGHLGMCLLAIVSCAVYVSVINDFTDMEDDQKAGKKNRLANFSKAYAVSLIILLLIIGGLFFWYFLPDQKTAYLYLGSWIVYSLYSFQPFRLKNRGWMGVLADACGAHLFPTLTILSAMEYKLQISYPIILFLACSLWSFLFGLRGILWHQYSDLKNDQKSKTNTLATRIDRSLIKRWEPLFIGAELILFSVLIYTAALNIVFLIAAIYFIYCWLMFKTHRLYPVIILSPENKEWYILMSSFYQTLFPITIMIQLGSIHFWYLLLIPIHVILFPKDIMDNISMIKGITRYYKIPKVM